VSPEATPDLPTVSAHARGRADRAGDPLDGLVNLFDLGIVLAVAFLLAALSSVKLTSSVLAGNKGAQPTVPAGAVVKNRNERTDAIKLQPGQTVVGQGKALGVVYQLSDGRTIIVRRTGTTTTASPVTPPPGAATTPGTSAVPAPGAATPPATTPGTTTPPAGGTPPTTTP
jgi:hypothetical protein